MTDQKNIAVMHSKNLNTEKVKGKAGKIIGKIITYAFLILMALIVIFPFYWMIISSLKSLEEYKLSVPTLFPQVIHWENYAKAFETANLWTLFKNTMYVGVVSTILSLVITVLSAFAFARLEFKGKDTLFACLLATMMIPGEMYTLTKNMWYRLRVEADITNVAVQPEYRRCGIGEMLMKDAENGAVSRKCESITLEVRVSNTAAISLYNKSGYKQAGIRKGFYEKPKEDALLMTKYFNEE